MLLLILAIILSQWQGSGLVEHSSASSPGPSLVLLTHHNISSRLDKQLVLKLHIRVESLEVTQGLPGGVVLQKALPLDEDAPCAATKLGAYDLLRGWQQSPVLNRWQHDWC